ncbi:MAG: ACT domain-containing protein [Desulfarculus sp.]|nr:ACT domain-containing protein [Desulfarculus sp.]
MTVKQITIQIPNQPGQLARVSELMGDAGVNILALFVSTTTPGGEGLMRFVADNPDKAANVLAGQGLKAEIDEVIAAETPHHAGGLMAVLNPLKRSGVNVDYLYPCIQTGEATILILGASQIKDAVEALKKDWIRLYGEELYNM